MPKRPNILLILTDQQAAGTLSCAGLTDIATPAIDNLARSGLRFENAYCTQPLCAPSRASLITGRHSHTVGVSDIGHSIDPQFREEELGRLFSAAGYDCGYAGKWHVPDAQSENSITLSPDTDHGFDIVSNSTSDQDTVEASVEFLKQDHTDPFLLVSSFFNPHDICDWARGQNLPQGEVDSAPPEDCPDLPKNFHPSTFEPSVIEEARSQSDMAAATEAEWRQYRHAYFRMIERVDDGVNRILSTLIDEHLADETLVVFTSDHGDGMGAHQWNQKGVLYEESISVPLIVSPPGGTGNAIVDNRLVSMNLDMLPTLCDYAGITPPADLPGRSLRPLIAGESPESWREQIISQTRHPDDGRMVRTSRFKYIVYGEGRQTREQLFDMQDDPGEMVNLAVNTSYKQVREDHRKRLLEWCIDTDNAFNERSTSRGRPRIPGYDVTTMPSRFTDQDEESVD